MLLGLIVAREHYTKSTLVFIYKWTSLLLAFSLIASATATAEGNTLLM